MQSHLALSHTYTEKWFAKQGEGSLSSTQVAVPKIMRLVPNVRSVVDVGCGVGAWLAEFKARGVEVIKGYDGGGVTPEQLRIPLECFERIDLTTPPPVTRRYDMALSLEVAEHLPATSAESFVKLLTDLSDVVVFSAAIPGQGGTHHINERPMSYWQSLFAARGYDLSNVLRARLWHEAAVDTPYRQNMVLALKRGTLPDIPRIGADDIVDVVHPAYMVRRPSRTKRRIDRAKLIGIGLLAGLLGSFIIPR